MQTKRLSLRPLEARDAKAIAALAGDWDVASMTGRVPYPYSEALADQWIDGLPEGEVVLGIEHEGRLIGVCGYMPGPDSTAEIGYWIGKPYWGQGFATEAAQALTNYCFTEAGFKRLTCGHFIDNPASARVIAKLGFRYVKTERMWCEARQANVDALKYERKRPMVMSLFRRRAA